MGQTPTHLRGSERAKRERCITLFISCHWDRQGQRKGEYEIQLHGRFRDWQCLKGTLMLTGRKLVVFPRHYHFETFDAYYTSSQRIGVEVHLKQLQLFPKRTLNMRQWR